MASQNDTVSMQCTSTATPDFDAMSTDDEFGNAPSNVSVSVQTEISRPLLVDNSTQTETIRPLHVEVICNEEPAITSSPIKRVVAESPAHQNMSWESIDLNDESFRPSASSESSESISTEDDEAAVDDGNCTFGHKFIVFKSELKKLMQICHYSPFCPATIAKTNKIIKGSGVTYELICNNHHTFSWSSQPIVNKVPLGNLLLTAATLVTGNTYTTVSEIFRCCGIQCFCERTFYNMQSDWVFPAISEMWQVHQNQMLSRRYFQHLLFSMTKINVTF